MNNLVAFNWSGGKDSTLALHYLLLEKQYKVDCLVTTINDAYNRIAMHGVREELLVTQAKHLGIPLHQIRLPEMPDMTSYEEAMSMHFSMLKEKGISYAAFGDIFLEDLKIYRENQFAKIGLKTLFPLWKRDSFELVKEFIALGYQTIVVCARADLKDFCGRIIDQFFLADLPTDIDPCGENGEFHTFVFDGPMFTAPIQFELGEKIYKEFETAGASSGYWYIDLIPT